MLRLISILILSLTTLLSSAQSPFSISLNPVEIPNLGGLQSYAFGQDDGQWLIIGGRLDGLHRRQPWATFDVAGHNNQFIVVDPETAEVWSMSLASLAPDLADQLKSTNMQFFQEGAMLYIVGGYGFSASTDDHTTFGMMAAVDVPAAIEAVISGADLAPHIRSISDPGLAVTGGRLEMISDMYYLVGGQNFEGRYNPMDNPTFVQEYTDAIRRFTIEDDGQNLSITWQPEWFDSALLHRRDFNVLPQIMPDGSEGLTAFSGVFRPDADIPFLDCVNITETAYTQQPDFSQYYNHYHCATVPLYSEEQGMMHTLFFGGIAQYYEEAGELVMDDEVPFVNTIARITRTDDGVMTEYKLPVEMPGYLGAGAEFVPSAGLISYDNGVIDLDEITTDSLLIGHIYGGIESSAKNIFWINTGTESDASANVFEVYLHQDEANNLDEMNVQSQNAMRMQLYPNGQTGRLYIDLHMAAADDVLIELYDIKGQLLAQKSFRKGAIVQGANELVLKTRTLQLGASYIVRATCANDSVVQKMIVNN